MTRSCIQPRYCYIYTTPPTTGPRAVGQAGGGVLGHPAARGGVSSGAPRLGEHAKPPTQNTTLGTAGVSTPEVTIPASCTSLRRSFASSAEVADRVGSTCQHHLGDFALAPRSSIDLDSMEEYPSRTSTAHGPAPVEHDRLVTDHHEIHNTIGGGGIKSSLGGMHSHATVVAASETVSHPDAIVPDELATVSNALSQPSPHETIEAWVDVIHRDHVAVGELRTASEIESLEAEFEAWMRTPSLSQGVDTLASTTASPAIVSSAPQQPTLHQQRRSRGARGGQQVRQRMQRMQAARIPRSPPRALCAPSPPVSYASLSLAPRV